MATTVQALVFDFDGTLVDSDDALVVPFLELGVARDQITFGHAVAEECDRLGIDLEDYASRYDTEIVQPFPGVAEVVPRLGRWAICSNKHPRPGTQELQRLGWIPEVAHFADHFDWAHKELGPLLVEMDLTAADVVMVGDSAGDVAVAQAVGCRYAWAGWNPRVRRSDPDGLILDRPDQLLDLYG